VAVSWVLASDPGPLDPHANDAGPTLARLASLAAWLGRHAQAVRSLSLSVTCLCEPESIVPPDARTQACGHVHSCLAALAPGGVLQQLHLTWAVRHALLERTLDAAHIAAMQSLHELTLRGLINIKGALHTLPALKRLVVQPVYLPLERFSLALPSSLTHLALGTVASVGWFARPPLQLPMEVRMCALCARFS